MACAILERASSFEPLFKTMTPRYLKHVTVPRFCSLILISLWMSLAQFVIYLVFSAPISILYLVQVLSSLSTRASSSYSSPTRGSMPSVNRELVMGLPTMLTFPSCSSRALDIILSKMLKRVGERKHFCLTSTIVLNHSSLCCH